MRQFKLAHFVHRPGVFWPGRGSSFSGLQGYILGLDVKSLLIKAEVASTMKTISFWGDSSLGVTETVAQFLGRRKLFASEIQFSSLIEIAPASRILLDEMISAHF